MSSNTLENTSFLNDLKSSQKAKSKQVFAKDKMTSKSGGCVILIFLMLLLSGIGNFALTLFYSTYEFKGKFDDIMFLIFIASLIGLLIAFYLRKVSLSYLIKTGALRYRYFNKSKWFNTLSMFAFGISVLYFIILVILLLFSCFLITIFSYFLTSPYENSSDNYKLSNIDLDNKSNQIIENKDIKKEETVYDLANKLKSYYELPQTITNELILEDIYATKNSIRFTYFFNNIDFDNVWFNREFFNILKKNTCNDNFLFNNVLSRNHSVDYEYKLVGTNKVYLYTVNRTHCTQ